MGSRHLVFLPLCLLTLTALPPAARASDPVSLWIGAAPEVPATAATESGVRLRDRYPDAIVVDDAASARGLAEAGIRVDGPFAASDAAQVFLLSVRGGAESAPGTGHALDRAGLAVLWENGRDFLVSAPRGLPDVLPGRLSGKRLSPTTLPARTPGMSPEARYTTAFDPLIDGVVAQVDSARYFPWIRRLAGAEPVVVGGTGMTFTTRSSYTPQCRSAEQYVLERFQAMGFTDVTYEPFQIGSTTARNVVATLPGVTTPERVYVIGGHLDSTSPNASTNAPGANDNASGTAAVLTAAELLKDYAFDSTIKFVAFTGEEQGLYGSEHFVTKALANGDDIRAAVTCDMIAWYGANYRIDIEGRTFALSLMNLMNDACAAYTALATSLPTYAWGSDHVPFLDAGIPAFLAIESDYDAYPCYHRTCDTADWNDAAFGVEVTRACLATVAHLAGIRPPAGTASPAVAHTPGTIALRPNPFRDETVLEYALAAPGAVRLTVYDVRGRVVRVLVDGPQAPGSHRVSWNARSAGGGAHPAGIYFVRLESREGASTARAVRVP